MRGEERTRGGRCGRRDKLRFAKEGEVGGCMKMQECRCRKEEDARSEGRGATQFISLTCTSYVSGADRPVRQLALLAARKLHFLFTFVLRRSLRTRRSCFEAVK